MRIIGIAGGIGSGKSTVTNHLRDKGYIVLDADEVAREAVEVGEPALLKLVKAFGKEILSEDGTLNRRKLAEIAFADSEKTKKLNKILHTDISKRIDKKINKLRQSDDVKVLFISAPLLLESDLHEKCDEIWVVTAEEEIRIKRAISRDNIPEQQVRDRMDKQLSENERIKSADKILDNNETIDHLIQQVDMFLDEL